MNSFEKENCDLINNFFERFFFSDFREYTTNDRSRKSIELFLTTECNLGCHYCYLKKNDNDLYPSQFKSHDLILKNTEIILDWIKENKFKVDLHVFSGEFFSLGDLPFKILDLILKKFPKEYTESKIFSVVIPTNMSFVGSKELTKKVSKYIKKMHDENIRLVLSASIDGKYLENINRKSKNKDLKRNDVYYDNLFKFAKEHKIGFHPMVSANGIENWVDNYKWFLEKFKEIDEKRYLMMLEVRDDNWDSESINHLIKLLDFIVDHEFENRYNFDKREFAKRIFIKNISNYDNIALKYYRENADTIKCSIQSTLFIRVGDLEIVPCHRLSYNHLNYAKFKVESDRIVGIEPKNISAAITTYSLLGSNLPSCESCSIKNWCAKGCLGSQYEKNGEMFIPVESVCQMKKEKLKFLFRKYYDLGIFDEALKLSLHDNIKRDIKKIIEVFQNECN